MMCRLYVRLCKMPFSVVDRSAIKVLRQDKQYGAETLLNIIKNVSK